MLTERESVAGPPLGPAAARRCRRRVHLDHDPDADRTLRTSPDAGLQLRAATLAEHREAVRRRLAEALHLHESWTPDRTDRPSAIWGARLRTPTRFATPELLLRAADGGYLPVLVRGHRTLDPGSGAWCSALPGSGAVHAPEDLASPKPSAVRKPRSHHADVLALAHVYRLLEELGLASSLTRGGVIGFGGPAAEPGWDDGAVILWHELGPSGRADPDALTDYDARFADRLAVARASAARAPALARPSRVAECRRCPWWPVCEPELVAARDISLLVAGADVDVLHQAGVNTYDDLAALDPAVAADLPLTGIPPADARARALALIAGVPMARRTGTVAAPRADVELDVDMESYLDDGAYLWGTYLTGTPLPGFPQGYRPFVTWRRLDQPAAGENFAQFWRYLCALREACAGAGLTFAAYCYSRKAEERWLYGTPQRFPDVPGMPSQAEVDRFCRSGEWVDLYAELKRNFVVPGSLRLKKVAAVAGFAWRDPEPSGENSMAWYRIATGGDEAAGARPGLADGGAPRGDVVAALADAVQANRERILRYNEDDVRATLALRHWMSGSAADLPTVADLEAGVPAGT